MSTEEDQFRPGARTLQALIAPIVAVLLIFGGVVVSLVLTGANIQNKAEIERSQRVIDSAFRLVGRDLGRLALGVAQSQGAEDKLIADFDLGWAGRKLSSVRSSFGDAGAIVVAPDNRVMFHSDRLVAAEVSRSMTGLIADARSLAGNPGDATSAFVIHGGQLHVAAASLVGQSKKNGTVLILAKPVDEAFLQRMSDDFLIDRLSVESPSQVTGRVGIVIESPQRESLAVITWSPAKPGDELFEYLLVPIMVAGLIAGLLLVNFLRSAVQAAQQLKRGAAALAESGEALEHSETMLRAIIDGVADGIVTFGESGRIASANASVERIFGYEVSELIGQPADMLLAGSPASDGGEPGPVLKALPKVQDTEYREYTGRRKDGARFVLDTAISHTTFQSRAIAIAIMRDITERKHAEETLNLLSTGMALVDRDARLLLANRSAARLLDSGDGLSLVHGRVSAVRRDQVDQLRDLVDRVCTGGVDGDRSAGVMTIERSDDVRPLSIKVAPVQLNAGDDASSAAAIFIRDLEVRHAAPPEVVAQLFGLTFAEARVVSELVKGRSPQEVADELGVSVNTVRNQLKQIFSKTNTGRQAELVSLVLSSAAFVSEHGLEIDESVADGDPRIQLTGS